MRQILLALALLASAWSAPLTGNKITADGTYTVTTTPGKRYVFSASGTFGSGSLAINWTDSAGTSTAFANSPASSAETWTFTAPTSTVSLVLSGATDPSITVGVTLAGTSVDIGAADITDPENIVTNARVVSAIESDASAIRTAADTISRTEYESLMTALLDPVASSYQATTGIDLADASDLSAFMRGLDSIGIASSFVDGYTLQSRFQKASGSTAYSIRQQANLAITGSPTRHPNGFLFANDSYSSPTSAERLYGNFPAVSTEWTVISSCPRDKEAATDNFRYAYYAFAPGNASNVHEKQNGLNWQGGGKWAGVFTTTNVSTHSPSEYRYRPLALRNLSTGASDSFKIRENTTVTDYSATGYGAAPFSRMTIGTSTNNDGSTFTGYYNGMVSYLLVFNAALTDQNLVDLNALISRTIHRKVKWIFDGDSISTESLGWAWGLQTASSWLGRNLELSVQGMGGETSIGVAARIGKQGVRLYQTANPTNGETVVLNGRTYTFKTTLASANDVKIGATLGVSQFNFMAAINGSAGEGTLYGTGTTANATFSASQSISGSVYLLYDSSASAVAVSETLAAGYMMSQDATIITTTVPMGLCAELKDPVHPTWYLCNVGHNDRGDTVNWQASLANLRATWAAARSLGYKVVACTVTGADSFSSGYWYGSSGDTSEAGRVALNAAIRADSANYDALLDVDDYLTDTYGANYWQNTAVLLDGVHPSTATRRAVMNHLWTLVGSQMP